MSKSEASIRTGLRRIINVGFVAVTLPLVILTHADAHDYFDGAFKSSIIIGVMLAICGALNYIVDGLFPRPKDEKSNHDRFCG